MQKQEEELELKIEDKDKTEEKIKGIKTFNYKDLRVLHKLGTGGFGTVRLAKQRLPVDEDSLPALKKSIPSLTLSDDLSTQEESDSSVDSPIAAKQAPEENKISKFVTKKTISKQGSGFDDD